MKYFLLIIALAFTACNNKQNLSDEELTFIDEVNRSYHVNHDYLYYVDHEFYR